MRVQDRPVHKTSAAVAFSSFETAAASVRALVQSGLPLANCRLLDQGEATLSGSSPDRQQGSGSRGTTSCGCG